MGKGVGNLDGIDEDMILEEFRIWAFLCGGISTPAIDLKPQRLGH